jgi:VanZ family protein
MSPDILPYTGLPSDFEHFCIYGLAGLVFGLGYGRKPILVTLFVVFAGLTEVAQLFVRGRHARLSDFIIDALAMCIGLALASLLKWRVI